MRRTYIRGGHTNGENIHLKGHIHEGDINVRTHTRRDIYIQGQKR